MKANQKNILILTSYISGHGGIESVINNINDIVTEELKGEYKIDVLSLSDGVYKNKGFVSRMIPSSKINWFDSTSFHKTSFCLSNKKVNSIFHSAFLVYFLMKNKYDIILCTGPGLCYMLNRIKLICKFNFLIYGWPHFSINSGNGDFKKFAYADKILCISKGIMEEFSGICVSNDKLAYFPNPFSKNEEYEIKNDTENTQFLYIGRFIFEGQKRIKDILDACKDIIGEYHLTIIGDGEEYEMIVNYISDNSLEKNITVKKGWMKDPWSYVSNCHALILSSKYEGLPTVLGEALSRGIPCIASNCSTGPADFIIPGVNGFLYEPLDVSGLKYYMQKFVLKQVDFNNLDIKESIDIFYRSSFIERWKGLFNK